MDKGAHFHRCDFQVHSPRDINWHGQRPATEDERKDYAVDFIKACRTKGLDAVAITDHHDTAFFEYIREASENELRPDGTPVPESERIVVFPGMELTLGVPCQALLIFDAEFPIGLLSAVETTLALMPNAPSEPKHAETKRLENFKNFDELHARLDEQAYIKGRYIILPNVNCGGEFTLRRTGFIAHYKSMPCIGGYLDHGIDKIKPGDRDILDGKNEAYAYKSLGVFPTSDNRHADFSLLGKNTAWVKWAEPTAEALRQACLARKTRIFHVAPQMPTYVIETVRVSLSKFLGAVDLCFNPQFNCLIGGRGTGKSSVLEYLRWALCDQPPALQDVEDVPDFQAKRAALIQNTLTPHKASVTVEFRVNGVRHVIRRNAETSEVLLKVADEDFKQVREQDVRELLPLQAYSQKQLSAVGVRAEELLRFVEAPVAKKLSEIASLDGDAVAAIRTAHSAVLRKRSLEETITRQEVELSSLEKQQEATRGGLVGLAAEDQDALQAQEKLGIGAAEFADWQRNVEAALGSIRRTRAELQRLPHRYAVEATLPNNELLTKADQLIAKLFSSARTQLEAAENLFTESSPEWREYNEINRQWTAKREAIQRQYDAVKQKATQHEAVLKQIGEIDARIASLRATIAERKATFDSHGSPEVEFEAAREKWRGLFKQRAELLAERCKELTKLSDGAIRATLKRGVGVTKLVARVAGYLEGTGIRGKDQKSAGIGHAIQLAADPIATAEAILSELSLLARIDYEANSAPAIPATPLLAAAGFTAGDLEKVARRLKPEDWLELAVTEVEDVPTFEYRQREGDYIRFSEASAGQQATALLRVLLHQAGPPLIIDQPEEDLDNQVILEVAEEIWTAKGNRQVIFTSHNANIVVNGDADLVVVCGYRNAGDQSGGKIKCEGAIDVAEIRKEITQIMEGGKKAFRMRKEKYGF